MNLCANCGQDLDAPHDECVIPGIPHETDPAHIAAMKERGLRILRAELRADQLLTTGYATEHLEEWDREYVHRQRDEEAR